MAKKRRVKNPVARNMEEFNRPATHRDKTKYRRKNKKGPQDLFIWLLNLRRCFCYSCQMLHIDQTMQRQRQL